MTDVTQNSEKVFTVRDSESLKSAIPGLFQIIPEREMLFIGWAEIDGRIRLIAKYSLDMEEAGGDPEDAAQAVAQALKTQAADRVVVAVVGGVSLDDSMAAHKATTTFENHGIRVEEVHFYDNLELSPEAIEKIELMGVDLDKVKTMAEIDAEFEPEIGQVRDGSMMLPLFSPSDTLRYLATVPFAELDSPQTSERFRTLAKVSGDPEMYALSALSYAIQGETSRFIAGMARSQRSLLFTALELISKMPMSPLEIYAKVTVTAATALRVTDPEWAEEHLSAPDPE